MEQDYEALRVLGEGAFGKVYQARHRRSNELVAVKEIKLGSRSWDEARKSTELQALRALRSPFIVRLNEVIRNQHDGSLFYVFEFIDSDLCRLLKQHSSGLDELRALTLARQLFTGLHHMHQHGFFHRDLKPENVLFETSQETIRICDFGQARSLRARPPFTDYVGTRWYRAPECLLRDEGYSSPIDVWAGGLIFAELIRGSPLFTGSSSLDQLYRIFAVLGTPSGDWPEFARLAQAARLRKSVEGIVGLQGVLPPVSEATLAALENTMTLNPRRRPTARHCIELAAFTGLPPIDAVHPRSSSRCDDLLDEDDHPGHSQPSSHSQPAHLSRHKSCPLSSVAHQQATSSSAYHAQPSISSHHSQPFTRHQAPPVPRLDPMETVNDIDLDAELDKILRDTPTEREAPDMKLDGNKSAESFNEKYLNSSLDRGLQQLSSLSLGASNGI